MPRPQPALWNRSRPSPRRRSSPRYQPSFRPACKVAAATHAVLPPVARARRLLTGRDRSLAGDAGFTPAPSSDGRDIVAGANRRNAPALLAAPVISVAPAGSPPARTLGLAALA